MLRSEYEIGKILEESAIVSAIQVSVFPAMNSVPWMKYHLPLFHTNHLKLAVLYIPLIHFQTEMFLDRPNVAFALHKHLIVCTRDCKYRKNSICKNLDVLGYPKHSSGPYWNQTYTWGSQIDPCFYIYHILYESLKKPKNLTNFWYMNNQIKSCIFLIPEMYS